MACGGGVSLAISAQRLSSCVIISLSACFVGDRREAQIVATCPNVRSMNERESLLALTHSPPHRQLKRDSFANSSSFKWLFLLFAQRLFIQPKHVSRLVHRLFFLPPCLRWLTTDTHFTLDAVVCLFLVRVVWLIGTDRRLIFSGVQLGIGQEKGRSTLSPAAPGPRRKKAFRRFAIKKRFMC